MPDEKFDSFEAACYTKCNELAALIIRKQHDYGHGNILKFGRFGVTVRMSDKLERRINLEKRGGGPAVEESLEDTSLDLAGYSIIDLMLADGTFLLDLRYSDTPEPKAPPERESVELFDPPSYYD